MYGNEVVKEFKFWKMVGMYNEVLGKSEIKEFDFGKGKVRFCVYKDENENMIIPEEHVVDNYIDALKKAIVVENFKYGINERMDKLFDLCVLAYYADDLKDIGVSFIVEREGIIPLYGKNGYFKIIDFDELSMVLMEYAYEERVNEIMLQEGYRKFLKNIRESMSYLC